MTKKCGLIFGISGQDGALLASLLLSKGYVVHGTSRAASSDIFTKLVELRISSQLKIHDLDLTDYGRVLKLIGMVCPDEIYNLSGQSSPGLSRQLPLETLKSNALSTLNILEAIRNLGRGTRLFSANSSECFGETGGAASDESTPFSPKNPYGVAKLAAFWEVVTYRETYGLFACSGIMFNHESFLRPEDFVTRKITKAAARIAMGSSENLVLGDISVQRDWGWAPEYVEAMWAMLQRVDPQDFVIATGRRYTLQQFVECAFSALDLDWRSYVQLDRRLYRPNEVKSSYGSPQRIFDQIGWRARTLMPEVAARMAKGDLLRLKGVSLDKLCE